MNTENKTPWYVFLLVPIMFLIVAFHDWLSANNLLFPAVIALFAAVFGLLLMQGLKEWQKSDAAILSAYDIWKVKEGVNTKKVVFRALLGSGVLILLLLKESSIMPKPAKIVISILSLVVSLVPLLAAHYKKRANSRKSSRTLPITHVEVTVFLVGLIPSLFICFILGISIYHGVWWFAALPCLVFLVLLTRPLVAAVRTVYKRCCYDDEVHLRKGEEIDPWDRPDIDPEKYRKK